MSSAIKRKSSNPPPFSTPSKKNRAITSFFTPSSSSSSSSSGGGGGGAGSSTRFNKDKWLATLTAEQKDLLKLEINTLHASWLAALHKDLVTESFLSLKRFVAKEREGEGKEVYPKSENVYSWSRYCPLDTVKVVILGQDPYHGPNQAHGLCFSVLAPTPAPPSLRNIYTALENDFPSFRPPPRRSGLLVPWAQRGVLLLNACLTVRRGEANSHQGKGWERFTGRVLEEVVKRRDVVVMAWGSPAYDRVRGLGVEKKGGKLLRSVHPSPLSAYKGFFDCGHFKLANEWLSERYGAAAGPIDWSLHGNTPVGLPSAEVEAKGEGEKMETSSAAAVKIPEDLDDLLNTVDADEEEALILASIEAEEAAAASSQTGNINTKEKEEKEKEEEKEKDAAAAAPAVEEEEKEEERVAAVDDGEAGEKPVPDDDDDDDTKVTTPMPMPTPSPAVKDKGTLDDNKENRPPADHDPAEEENKGKGQGGVGVVGDGGDGKVVVDAAA